MTVVLSLERFLAVTYPIRHRNRSIGRTWIGQFIRYVSPAFAVSGLLFGLPLFFAFKMEEVTQLNPERSSGVNTSNKTLFIAEREASFEGSVVLALLPQLLLLVSLSSLVPPLFLPQRLFTRHHFLAQPGIGFIRNN